MFAGHKRRRTNSGRDTPELLAQAARSYGPSATSGSRALNLLVEQHNHLRSMGFSLAPRERSNAAMASDPDSTSLDVKTSVNDIASASSRSATKSASPPESSEQSHSPLPSPTVSPAASVPPATGTAPETAHTPILASSTHIRPRMSARFSQSQDPPFERPNTFRFPSPPLVQVFSWPSDRNITPVTDIAPAPSASMSSLKVDNGSIDPSSRARSLSDSKSSVSRSKMTTGAVAASELRVSPAPVPTPSPTNSVDPSCQAPSMVTQTSSKYISHAQADAQSAPRTFRPRDVSASTSQAGISATELPRSSSALSHPPGVIPLLTQILADVLRPVTSAIRDCDARIQSMESKVTSLAEAVTQRLGDDHMKKQKERETETHLLVNALGKSFTTHMEPVVTLTQGMEHLGRIIGTRVGERRDKSLISRVKDIEFTLGDMADSLHNVHKKYDLLSQPDSLLKRASEPYTNVATSPRAIPIRSTPHSSMLYPNDLISVARFCRHRY
jgi:hypothetical protein